MASVASQVVLRGDALIAACESDWRPDPVETITGELLPLCAGLRWIGKRGVKVLRDRHVGVFGRPLWMTGVRSTVQRVPFGEVLILGTWNYPLLLPGIQIAQALAAGNQVCFKPAVGTEAISKLLVDCFRDVGVDESRLRLLGSDVESATAAIDSGVDLVVLTGSAATGQKVLASVAPTLSASIMELSGCDAVLALPGCDTQLVARSLRFGLTFNGGATCIGPRRLLVQPDDHRELLDAVTQELSDTGEVTVHPVARKNVADQVVAALAAGAVDVLGSFDEDKLRNHGQMSPLILDGVNADAPIAQADLFAPVLSVIRADNADCMIRIVNDCPYRLAASVFGDRSTAQKIAADLNVGTVTINDLIAPTADPRLPFGGRGKSGFGVTRGREGLLAMTTARVVSTRRGRLMPHLDRRTPRDRDLLQGAMAVLHGGSLRTRLSGLNQLVRGVKTKTD